MNRAMPNQEQRQKVGQKCNKNQCLSRIRKMVILWDKIPLSNALAMSLQTAQRGGKMPPRCAVFPSIARFLTSGKPAFDLFNFDT